MRHFLLLLLVFIIFPSTSLAVENPLARPNNKMGIHILFDHELKEAATLINNKGDWGYIIVPIQSHDKNIVKWQSFMDEAKKNHVIPIIRLATEGDFFNTKVWRTPTEADVLDFANFLNSLSWPTKNKYIVAFNEVNRGDEWGGSANPKAYANILSYTVTAFKSVNQDFFVIGGGFDNAAPNQGDQYINQYTYMQQMNAAIPGIFNQIDGFASHSYPNPGFSTPPESNTTMSIHSFKHERDLLDELSDKKLPIFITETGWTNEKVSEEQRAQYYKTAFETVWNDPGIVAVIPFLLKASGEFEKFSFLTTSGPGTTKQYDFLKNMPKTKGAPALAPAVLSAQSGTDATPIKKSFKEKKVVQEDPTLQSTLRSVYEWIMRI